MQKTYTINEGVMWEDNPFEILINEECSQHGGSPCKHCHSFVEIKKQNVVYNFEYTEKRWICPAVVVVSNEAGFNSTGLCLDCLLEAVRDTGIREIILKKTQ